jgi:hypothetical protein
MTDSAHARDRTSACRDCSAGLVHCHGTVIHHTFQWAECTEPGCTTDEVVHSLRIDCEAIGCTCGVEVSAHRVG